MKNILVIVTFSISLLGSLNLKSQSYSWSAKNQVEESSTAGTYLCKDNSNNIYVVGYYRDENNYPAENAPKGSFISKYSSSGTLDWTYNTAYMDLRIAIDANNTILVSGIDEGGYFIAKYNSSGTQTTKIDLLPLNSDGRANSRILAIGADGNNNYYIAGIIMENVTFGSMNLTATESASKMFLVKYNSSNSCQWAISSTTGTFFNTLSMHVNSSGDIFLGGEFGGSCVIGSNTITASGINGFVSRYNSSGTIQWLYNVGSSDYSQELVSSLIADNSGNVYLTGTYHTPLVVGSTTLTTDNPGDADIFLIKLNSSGSAQWAVSLGGGEEDFVNGVAINSAGDVFVSGFYTGSADFGGTNLTTSGAGNEPFLAKYNSSGTAQWAIKTGCDTEAFGRGTAVLVDSNDDLFITGRFAGTMDFDSYSQTSDDGISMFIAKVTDLAKLDENVNVAGLSNLTGSAYKGMIFPNPGNGVFSLISPVSVKEIRVYDFTGKLVYLSSPASNSTDIDLTRESNGIYLVEVLDSQTKYCSRIVKH